MTQSVNGVPQLLKGLNIAFTGMFEPYSKLELISMCEKLGAKNVTSVQKTTSVLIQGTHIAGYYGNPHWGRDLNTTNKAKAAISKGVRIVLNDQIDDYFIGKTGETVEELMKIVKNVSSSSQHSNQNFPSENIPKPKIAQKSQIAPQLQKIHKTEMKKTQQNIKIPNPLTDKQEFKESVMKALHLAGFKDIFENSQYKEFIKMLATTYYEGELTFDGVIDYLGDILGSDTLRKRFIAVTMQLIKNDFHKQNQEKQKSQPYVSTDKLTLNQNKKSQNYVEKNTVGIENIKSKIVSSFEVLKKDCNKTKGVCYQSFNDIFDSIREIQNSNDVNTIHQTVNQLKKDVERCFFIYRTLGKSLKNYERELRPLVQEEHEIPDTESVCSSMSKNNSYDFDKQRPSKKERLAMKKQQKKMEKLQPTPAQQKNQPPIEINFNTKNSNDQNLNESDDQDFAHLPVLLYLKRNFSEGQIQERYKKLPSNQSKNKGVKESNRYSLTIKGKADFSMREFLRYDWRDLQRLTISSCGLKSQDWDLLCYNSQSLFKNLKVLTLTSNNIEEVRKEEILKFPQLSGVHFGKDHLNANPLSRQSLEDLGKWQKESNFDGKIILYKKSKEQMKKEKMDVDSD